MPFYRLSSTILHLFCSVCQFAFFKIDLSICTLSHLPSPTKALCFPFPKVPLIELIVKTTCRRLLLLSARILVTCCVSNLLEEQTIHFIALYRTKVYMIQLYSVQTKRNNPSFHFSNFVLFL